MGLKRQVVAGRLGGRRSWAARRRRELRVALKAGALARGARDLRLAREWFPLEEEAWLLGRGRH